MQPCARSTLESGRGHPEGVLGAGFAQDRLEHALARLGDFDADGTAAGMVAVLFVFGLPPLLFHVAVGAGIVASLARPGGNITGFSTFNAQLAAKRVELLKEIRPQIKRIAVLTSAVAREVSLNQIADDARALARDITHRLGLDETGRAFCLFAIDPMPADPSRVTGDCGDLAFGVLRYTVAP